MDAPPIVVVRSAGRLGILTRGGLFSCTEIRKSAWRRLKSKLFSHHFIMRLQMRKAMVGLALESLRTIAGQ